MDTPITIPSLPSLAEAIIRQVADRIAEVVVDRFDSNSRDGRDTPWMTVDEVAEYARMTSQAIRDTEKGGHLPAYRTTTGRLRFHIDDVEAFLTGKAE